MLPEQSSQNSVNWPAVKKLAFFSIAATVVILSIAYFFQSLLFSLSCSILFAYILAPVVDWMVASHEERRPFACFLLILCFLSLLGVLIASLLPEIYRQVVNIVGLIPEALEYTIANIEPLKKILIKTRLAGAYDLEKVISEINLFQQFSGQLQSVGRALWESTPSFLGGVMNFALVPIVLFFLLNDLPGIRRGLAFLTPPDMREPLQGFVGRVDKTLRSVIKGQLMVAGVLGVLYMIGLRLVGLESALAIGAIAGVCRIVPYLDVIVGIALSLIVIITQHLGLGMFIGVCLVFLGVQVLDGLVITPRVIGERVGLHPGVVIASVMAFGDWFGFVGIIVAVPTVAVIKVLLQTILPYYRLSSFYVSSEKNVAKLP